MKVQYLMSYTFESPAPLKITVIADPHSSWLPKDAGQLRRVSPDEEHHAFILATARDLAAGKSEQEWKAKWLSCIATFVRLDSQEAAFWRAGKERETIGAQYDSMHYSTESWCKLLSFLMLSYGLSSYDLHPFKSKLFEFFGFL